MPRQGREEKLFRGNGQDLLSQIQLSHDQWSRQVALAGPFADAGASYATGGGQFVSGEGSSAQRGDVLVHRHDPREELAAEVPKGTAVVELLPRVEGLAEELREIFSFYCSFGDRMNVGPRAMLKRSQLAKVRLCVGGVPITYVQV